MPVFTWQHRDGDFVLVDSNRAAEAMTGGRSNDLLGKKGSVLYADRPGLLDEIRQCFSNRGRISAELVSEHFLPGRHLHITATFVPPDLIMVHMEDITERKRAEQDLLRQNQMFKTINQLALEFASLSKSRSVSELAVKRLMKMSGAVLTSFSLYDPVEQTLRVTDFEIEPGILGNVVKLLGKRPGEMKIPVSSDTYQEIINNIVDTRKTLTEVSFGEIPPLVSKGIQKMTGIDHFIGLAYVVEGELYGTSILGFKRGQTDPSFELLGAFAHIVAVSLRRYRAESTLFESEEKYRTLVESADTGIIYQSASGEVQTWNPAAERIFGLPADQVIGHTSTDRAWDCVREDGSPFPASEHPSMITFSTGKPVRNTVMGVTSRTGSFSWITINTTPLFRNGDVKPYAAVITFQDITASKQAGQALAESERRYRDLVENLNEVIFMVDDNGLITYVSPVGQRQFGYAPEDLLGKPFTDVVYREDVPSLIRRFDEIGRGIIEPFEWRLVKKDGTYAWVRTSTRPVDPSGTGFIGIISDISREKQADEAIRKSEEKYRELYHNAAMGIFHSTLDGKFIDVNPALARMLGYNSPAEAVTSIASIAREVYAEPMRYDAVTTAVLGTGGIAKVENLYCRRDGSLWYGMLHVRIVHDQGGGPDYYEGFVEDITERKRAEQALMESEQRYRHIITDTQTGYFQIDTQGRFTNVNQAWLRMHGYFHETEVLGKHFSITQVNADQQAARVTVEHLLQGEKVLSGEFSRRMKNGATGYHTFSAVPVVRDGSIVGLEGFLIDVTERRRAEDALKESEEKYRRLFSRMAEGNALHEMVEDASGAPVDYRILDVNPAFEQIIGLMRDDVVGKTSREAYHVDSPPFFDTYSRVVATGQPEEFEVFFEPMKKHFAISAYSPGKGKFATIFEDITERKQSEELRDRLIRNLAQKNAELDKFTYTVSHDLKSPLIALQAYLSLLEEDLKTGDTGQVHTDIIRIVESADKLEDLITTLLSLSRSGRTVDSPVALSFTGIAREAAGILDSMTKDRGVTLTIPEAMPTVFGDRQRLVQVMTNLLDNAIKFMGDQKMPRVEVGVRHEGGKPVFFVRDNGMGIRTEELPNVFGLFERFNPEVPGTGIGLATVKRIIEAHGGWILVESEGPGKGTTISFTLPPAGESTDKDKSG
jgi:PAS domain S-box-containing protein